MDMASKVRALLDRTGWTQQQLADRVGVTQPSVNRWLEGAQPRGAQWDQINALYDQAMADDAEIDEHLATVPLVGYVGAGAVAHFYQQTDENLDRVDAPDGTNHNTRAVEIRGDSLGPLFEHWLVFFDDVRSPVTPDLIGRLCVVGLPDDRVLIKKLRKSAAPGLYHLLSNTEDPILDVAVNWAALVKSMVPR